MRVMQFRIALIAGLALVVLSSTWGTAPGPALSLAVHNQAAGAAASPAAATPAAGRSSTVLTEGRTVKVSSALPVPNGSWPTYHRDDGRTGSDPTLPAVSTVTTGWTSAALDGQIYASPLVYGGVVYTATLNNTVYALNQATGSQIWSTHLRTPKVSGWGCGNVTPQGILGTPVIDPAGGRVYVATLDSSGVYRVEGLNLTNGVEELNTIISTSGFDWRIQQQRGALAVFNGYVYVPFGGRAGDCGNYSGWVFGVPTSGSATVNFYRTPGIGNGIWAPGGVVVDDSTGNVFAATGNGDVNNGCSALVGGAPQFENDAVVRLSPTLAEQDFFMPPDWEFEWCKNDQDLGSAAPLLISPNLLFQSGKWGTGFLLDPTNLGHVGGQRFPTPKPATYSEANVCFGNTFNATFGSFAYSAPFIYAECEGHGLAALHIDTSVPTLPTFNPCDTCAAPDWHAGGTNTFGPPIVAAGAVWVANDSGLFAYRASTGALIYHSAGFGVNRFVTPAEAGGQVFVPSLTVIRSFVMHVGASQSIPAPSPPARTTPVGQSSAQPPGSRSPASQSSPAPPPFER